MVLLAPGSVVGRPSTWKHARDSSMTTLTAVTLHSMVELTEQESDAEVLSSEANIYKDVNSEVNTQETEGNCGGNQ